MNTNLETTQLLNALASVLDSYVDKNGLLYFKQKIDAIYSTKAETTSKLDAKVDKVPGKQLSTNDYTTEEKNKLAGLNNYTLPTASSTVKGGVKVGAGLAVTEDGILSATGGGTADAVAWENVTGRPTKVSQFTNDVNYVKNTEMTTALKDKVDVVVGKQLSTNDLTNELKVNYDAAHTHSTSAHAPSNAQANVIESVKVNGVALVPDTKAVDVKVPTKVSELSNDSKFLTSIPSEYVTDSELTAKGYQTAVQVNSIVDGKGFLKSVPAEYVTETELNGKGYQTANQVSTAITSKGYQTAQQVQTMINNAQHMKREIVSQLPEPSAANELTIYLVKNSKGTYDEYMLIEGKLDKIGASDVNLEGYLNTTNFKPLSNAEIDTIFA